jgi:hypothetical protein
VLAELGSVDTAEQGLVIYKAFLQKASEMLALAQQQQQQPQPGESFCPARGALLCTAVGGTCPAKHAGVFINLLLTSACI